MRYCDGSLWIPAYAGMTGMAYAGIVYGAGMA